MAGKVVPLRRTGQGSPETKGPMPERFSPEQKRRLLELAAGDGFTYEEVAFAVRSVRIWWETRRQERTRWHLVVLNAMRLGWGLRGFGAWQKRQAVVGHNARGEPVYRRTRLTPELIDRLCSK